MIRVDEKKVQPQWRWGSGGGGGERGEAGKRQQQTGHM